MTFVYYSGRNGLRTGEKSRFLYQLLLESPFRITESGIDNTIDPTPFHPITIEKTGKVLEVLNGFQGTDKKLSPTALYQYLHCPLSFYFKYIAHFQEEDDVTEEVDARMFGKLFHFVMEKLYRPFLGAAIDKEKIHSLIEDEEAIEGLLKEAFGSLFFKSEVNMPDFSLSGRNIMVFEVLKKMVLQTLEIDLKRAPFVIAGLEHYVDATVAIFNETKHIRIGGIIDRIDYKSGTTVIIDYKTGSAGHDFSGVGNLFDRKIKNRNKAAFQTLIYGLIWDRTHPESGEIYPAIYGLRKIFTEDTIHLTNKENPGNEVKYRDVSDQFGEMLTNLLEEIFNAEQPFVQTSVEENCQYCNFASICGKQVVQS